MFDENSYSELIQKVKKNLERKEKENENKIIINDEPTKHKFGPIAYSKFIP